MKIKHNAIAAFLGIAVALAAAPGAFAASDITKVMTNPCAQVMNWPVRSIALKSTPPSERGLQCPIQDFSAPLE